MKYTDEHIAVVKREIAKGPSVAKACKRLTVRFGTHVDPTALALTLKRRGIIAGDLLPRSIGPSLVPGAAPLDPKAQDTIPAPPVHINDLVPALLTAVRKKPLALDDLCERLGLTAEHLGEVIAEAKHQGYSVEQAHGHVAIKHPEPDGRVIDTGVRPATSGRQQVAVITDTHLGSKFCLRAQLADFVNYAYDSGVREVLHVGDALDGRYRHGMFELTHAGIEDQTRDLFEVLPQRPGLSYHGITGNHDDTFADEVGMSPGDYMQWYFQKHGRTDLHFYGRRGAYLKVRGAVVELWHPRSGGGYALSYQLQNHIRAYGVGQKPDILLAGHWHTFVYLEQRGVHALACGTFQGGGSAFSKSLGGAPSIGGTILSWELTDARTLRRFSVARSAYYEREEVRELELA